MIDDPKAYARRLIARAHLNEYGAKFYASANPLDSLADFVEIDPLAIAPVMGDLVLMQEPIDGKKGIFRVRQRSITTDTVYLWLKYLED